MRRLFHELFDAAHKPFDLRIERLVALLRVALTSFCLIALLTTRTGPTSIIELTLAAHTIFGIHIVLWSFISKRRSGWQLPAHIVDIGLISVLRYLIGDISSTVSILHVFVLLSATLRWNWRGALWTTAMLVALQAILFFTTGGFFEFVVQYTFVFLVGGMFAFFGAIRERSRDRLGSLADWPNIKGESEAEVDNRWLESSLRHIAAIMDVPRVLVMWEVLQEPCLFTALLADGKFERDNKPTNGYGNLVAADLAEKTFASDALKTLSCITPTGEGRFFDQLLEPSLQKHWAISSVCTAPLSGEICKGRVFMLDRPYWGEDDLMLAEAVASRLRIELEHRALYVGLKESSASRERVRLARDLHDGVLQTLTAAGLQLKMIASRARNGAVTEVENVRKLLFAEQQRIRGFVDGRTISITPELIDLSGEMQRELDLIRRQWGCDVALSVNPRDINIPATLGSQLEFILAEASANAVQHGQASRIDVAIDTASDKIQMRIADNGHGLDGTARIYTQSELAALNIGPRSLRKRIAALNGSLSLSSSALGVELRIELPCALAGQQFERAAR
jgi:signal transduction histidine kinase